MASTLNCRRNGDGLSFFIEADLMRAAGVIITTSLTECRSVCENIGASIIYLMGRGGS